MMSATASLRPDGAITSLQRSLSLAERRRKWRAFALTLPLLVFLLLTFLVPIAALLKRAVENPEVAASLSRTVAALENWDRSSTPPPEAFAAIVADLGAMADRSEAGALARRLNTAVPGGRSLVMPRTSRESSPPSKVSRLPKPQAKSPMARALSSGSARKQGVPMAR